MIFVSPEDRAFLDQARVGHLATASAEGEPHAVPICFVFDGTAVYTAIDAKPKRGDPRQLRRLQNIRENPRASLLVDHYEEDWHRLRYVLLRGRAEILEAGPDRERAFALLCEKYPQYRRMPGFGTGPVIRLTPETVRSWRAAAAAGARSDLSSGGEMA